jgi:YD repeat-containing protein
MRNSSIFHVSVALLALFSCYRSSLSQTSVGSIAGTFEVTSTGSATYVIPLRVTPGSSGMEPKISISYNSQATGGPLGAGWSISGLSSITRGNRNLQTDGRVTGVSLTDNDALYLDGERLIPIASSGSGASKTVEYRKRVDDVSRTTQVGADLASSTFVTETKGGLKLYFNGANNSRILAADQTTLLFAISKIVDTSGNYIEFHYVQNGNGDYNVDRISYTGHEPTSALGQLPMGRQPYAFIDFTYETPPRTSDIYVAGRLIKRSSRLVSIVSRISQSATGASQSSMLSKYVFDYQDRDTSNRFVLAAIHQFGEDGTELTPTQFTYKLPDTSWQQAAFQLPISVLAHNENLKRAYRFAHFSTQTPALPDLLFSAEIDGKREGFAYTNSGGIWSIAPGFAPPVTFVSADGTDQGVLLVDLNGDGKVDILKSYQRGNEPPERSAFLAGQDAWAAADGYSLPYTINKDGKTVAVSLFASLSGGSGPDLLYAGPEGSGFLQNTGSGWKNDPLHKPTMSLVGARFVDVDCDGKPELVVPVEENGQKRWAIYRYGSAGWGDPIPSGPFDIPFTANVSPDAWTTIDLDKDQCNDLIVASAKDNLHLAFHGSATGWKSDDDKAPQFDLVDATGNSTGYKIVDLDADGLPDITAARTNSDQTITAFTYLQTAHDWKKMSGSWLLPDSIDASSGAFVGDIDGDGRADVVVPSGQRLHFGRVYAGSQTGFSEKPAYVPEVSFAKKGLEDKGIRYVDLNGDGLPDILYRRETLKDGVTVVDAGAFINTGNGWRPAPDLVPPLPFSGDGITGNPVQFIDVDRDGFIDMLYSFQKADGTIIAKYFRNDAASNGNRKWVEQVGSALTPPKQYPFAQEKVGDLGVRFVDLNGDGRPDMLVGLMDKGDAEICTPDANTPGQQNCSLNRGLFKVAAFLNDGKAWIPAPAFNSPLPFASRGQYPGEPTRDLFVQVVDVDGDGLPDIVARFQHPYKQTREVSEVWINTGSGWKESASIKSPTLLDLAERNPRAEVQWLDINGDGLQDVIVSERHGAQNQASTWLSTGNGFVQSTAWTIPLDAQADRDGDSSFRLLDLNGDGFVDLLYSRLEANGSVVRGAYLNIGSGWKPLDSTKVASIPPFNDDQGADLGVRLFDVDGNGLPDILQSFEASPTSNIAARQVLLNTSRRADVLDTIDTGYGLRTTIDYQTLLETPPSNVSANKPWNRVYVPNDQPVSFPEIAATPTTYVVDRTLTRESDTRAIAYSYRYGNYRVHSLAFESLGFGWREEYNEATGLLSHIDFEQTMGLVGRIKRVATCFLQMPPSTPRYLSQQSLCTGGDYSTSSLSPLSETTSAWKLLGPFPSPIDSSTALFRPELKESTSTLWELDQHETSIEHTVIDYDDSASSFLDRHLNVVKTKTDRMDGSYVETKNEYSDDASRWYLGRLTKSTSTKVGDVIPSAGGARKTESSTSLFTYDPVTGLLLTESTNVGTPSSVLKQYGRDDSGNVILTTLSAGTETDRTTTFTFDSLSRFPIKVENALHQTTSTSYYQTNGLAAEVKDPNGLKTTYKYDGFGRQISETIPSGMVTRTEFLTPAQISAVNIIGGLAVATAVRISVTDSARSLPPSLKLLDNKGRIIRSVADGFTLDAKKQRLIFQDSTYDLMGRNESTTLPYDLGGPQKWTRRTFDILSRLTETLEPNGSKTTVKFSARPGGGTISTITDGNNHNIVRETDTRGWLVSIADALKGTATYSYDAAGRIEQVRGPSGSLTTTTYTIDKPKQIIDADMGSWTYTYDAFGELIKQVDAKAQVVTVQYDLLGRPLVRTAPDGNTTWTYDNSQRGIGHLTSVRIANKYEKLVLYDQYGRPNQVSTTVGSDTFTTSTEFDSFGRVLSTSYPSVAGHAAVDVVNKYDDKGYFSRVTSKNGIDLYWEALAIDASGRVTSERFGNGVVTNRTYEADTGRLGHITTATATGNPILDLGLS